MRIILLFLQGIYHFQMKYYLFVLVKNLKSLEDVKNIRLFTQGESRKLLCLNLKIVKLSEIADVTYESENKNNFTRINGEPGVRFGVIAEGGANVVAIVEQVRKKWKRSNFLKDMK